MPYTAFADGKPVSSDNGLTVVTNTRENLMALRDAIVLGATKGWDMSKSGGTNEEPAIVLYTKSTERLRASLTWGTSGGSAGNVTQAIYAYSSNSGSSYDTIGTLGVTYNSDGTVASTTWS